MDLVKTIKKHHFSTENSDFWWFWSNNFEAQYFSLFETSETILAKLQMNAQFQALPLRTLAKIHNLQKYNLKMKF